MTREVECDDVWHEGSAIAFVTWTVVIFDPRPLVTLRAPARRVVAVIDLDTA